VLVSISFSVLMCILCVLSLVTDALDVVYVLPSVSCVCITHIFGIIFSD
jgi:hypothetical protein